jgi:hypothetical protein
MSMDKSSENTPCIWIVRGHYDLRNSRGWLPFEAPSDTERCPEEIIEAMELTERGHFLPQSRFPADNYPRSNDNEGAHRMRFPQIFSAGFFFLRKESADILRRFDLGEGALYPTRLWHPDRKTPVLGEYFYLSQGNKKDAFLLEQSPMADSFPGKKWWLPPNPIHDQLVFSEAALNGPDIWWDSQIAHYFFISDQLAQALKKAKLVRDWMLLRCPVFSN